MHEQTQSASDDAQPDAQPDKLSQFVSTISAVNPNQIKTLARFCNKPPLSVVIKPKRAIN